MTQEFWLTSFLILLVSFNTTLFFTPLIRKFSASRKYHDNRDDRTVHKKVVTRLGGAAIYAGIVLSLFILFAMGKLQLEITALLIGSFIIFLLGTLDDIRRIAAPAKLAVQLVASFVVIQFGFRINVLTIPFSQISIELPLAISYAITVFWLLLITNALNFIDGLDGLAAGISTIASIALFGISIRTGRTDIAVAFMAITGSCFGFLRYNFHPAKLFMGDSGSTTIGFTLACLALFGTIKAPTVFPLLIPLVALGIPTTDILLAVLRRLKNKKNPLSPDKKHLHHKLLDTGLSHRDSVIILYSVTILLGLIAFTFSPHPSLTTAAFALATIGIILIVVRRILIKQR